MQEQSYTGGPGLDARKHLRAREGGLLELRDSLVNRAKRAGILQLHELLRTQIPQLRKYFMERGKVWGKGRRLKEITGKIHRSFHGGLLSFLSCYVKHKNRNESSLSSATEESEESQGITWWEFLERTPDAAITGVNHVFTN